MSDLIYIIIDGTQIAASKENLMTNSKYFEAMFQDHFLETNKKSVEIHSVKIDAFQVILEWTKERMMNRDLQNNWIEGYSIEGRRYFVLIYFLGK